MTELKIEVKGLDKLEKAFERFPREIAREMSQAGHEAGDMILANQGLRNYPPLTDANFPPTPYYKRGTGTVVSGKTTYATSENLGKKWHVRRTGAQVEIGNVASYAEHVHGEEQAEAMKNIGWRKLKDVADDKMKAVKAIYQAHINALIRRLGL